MLQLVTITRCCCAMDDMFLATSGRLRCWQFRMDGIGSSAASWAWTCRRVAMSFGMN